MLREKNKPISWCGGDIAKSEKIGQISIINQTRTWSTWAITDMLRMLWTLSIWRRMSSMVNCSEREVASVSFKVDFDKFRVLGHTKVLKTRKENARKKCHLFGDGCASRS